MKKSLILMLAFVFAGFAVSSAEAGPIRNLLSRLKNRSGACASGACR